MLNYIFYYNFELGLCPGYLDSGMEKAKRPKSPEKINFE